MLSIIVLSSDGYSDCWEPFFKLLKMNFPEAVNYEIILSSNSKKFKFDGLNIKSLTHGEKTPWSKRLKLSLDRASNDIVMVLVEDFFIFSKLNFSVFECLLDQISNNNSIDHIRLLYKMDEVKTRSSKFKYLDEIVPRTKYRFLYLPGLWSKRKLRKYIVDFETPYMAEKMGDVRSWVHNDSFYAVSNDYVESFGRLYDCPTSGSIIKGKWGMWLPERLSKNGISLDYSHRGFKDAKSNQRARKQIFFGLLMNPITTIKSILSILIIPFKSLSRST